MSHLHLSDGLLPMPWVIIWSCAAAVLLSAALYFLRRADLRRLAPRIGVFAALLLLVMSLEWLGLYHLNLTSLAAIVIGPWAAVLVLFIVNLAMALIGHGGLTTFGLSTVILCIEALSSFVLFRLFARKTGKASRAAFAATLLSLVIAFAFMALTVSVSIGAPSWLESAHHDNPGGVLSWSLTESHGGDSALAPRAAQAQGFSWRPFLGVMVLPGLIGWPIEALIVSSLIGYIAMARPDLIQARNRK